MKASVIICTYNRAGLLKESIHSVLEQDYPSDQFEIIVVDNNSTDNTKNVVKELVSSSTVKIKYVFEKRQGLSYARNAGIEYTDGDIIIFTDDDIEAERTWLRELISVFDSPDVACAGGPIKPIWPFKKPDWLSEKWIDFLTVSEFKSAYEKGEFKGENEYPWGANMAFRKEIFKIIGMFSTSLGRIDNLLLSNEEILLFMRIKASSKLIGFAPNAVIYHKILPERLKKLWFYHRTYWQGRSNAILDINIGNNIYTKLRQYAPAMLWREIEKQENDFDNKCVYRLVIGYLHQLILSDKNENDMDMFRKLRALETFLKEVMKNSAQLMIDKENKINELGNYIDEKNNDLKQLMEVLKDKDDLLKQKDEQLRQFESLLKQEKEQFRQKCAELIEVEDKFKAKCMEVVTKDQDLMRLSEERSAERQRLIEVEDKFKAKCMEVVTKDQDLMRLSEERSAERQRLIEELRQKDDKINQIMNSYSWKLTAPLRRLRALLLR